MSQTLEFNVEQDGARVAEISAEISGLEQRLASAAEEIARLESALASRRAAAQPSGGYHSGYEESETGQLQQALADAREQGMEAAARFPELRQELLEIKARATRHLQAWIDDESRLQRRLQRLTTGAPRGPFMTAIAAAQSEIEATKRVLTRIEAALDKLESAERKVDLTGRVQAAGLRTPASSTAIAPGAAYGVPAMAYGGRHSTGRSDAAGYRTFIDDGLDRVRPQAPSLTPTEERPCLTPRLGGPGSVRSTSLEDLIVLGGGRAVAPETVRYHVTLPDWREDLWRDDPMGYANPGPLPMPPPEGTLPTPYADTIAHANMHGYRI